MSRVKVASFGMSIDGFSAGPRQSLEDPLCVSGTSLMAWFFPTRTFQQTHGGGGGETGIDLTALGFKCAEHITSRHAMHVVLSK